MASSLMELLPKDYGYVILVAVLYSFLNFFMGIMAAQVGRARKKYKVFYPTMYASESDNKDAKVFNCVQRGHQNSLEMMPLFFVFLILGGLRHPCISASLGLVYTVSRYFYFKGYSTGDPQKRLSIGKYGFLAIANPNKLIPKQIKKPKCFFVWKLGVFLVCTACLSCLLFSVL